MFDYKTTFIIIFIINIILRIVTLYYTDCETI